METVADKTSAQKILSRSHGAMALEWTVVLLAVINVAFTVRRMHPIFFGGDSALMPVVTSGCEEEALFSIWKFVQGQPVYSDPSSIPYAISYFNWLFYWSYGVVTKTLLAVFHLDVSWLPTIARGITLSLVVGSAAMAYAIIQQLSAWPLRWGRIAKLSFVSLCFFNEFFGEWIATVRPDLGALFCELAALWCAIKYFQHSQRRFLCAAVLGCYAAWAFKHNMITVLASLCLALMLGRRWRELASVVGVTIFLYALTFGLGGPLYRFAILESQKQCALSFHQCWKALTRAFDLAAYLPVIALAALGTFAFYKHLRWNAPKFLLCASAMVSGALMLMVSAKHGSDYNYFFAPSIFGLLWLVVLHQSSAAEGRFIKWLRMGLPVAIFAFCATAVPNVAALVNERRIIAKAEQMLTEQQRRALAETPSEVEELRKALLALPSPVLITERRFNLPWIQSRAPHFVVAYGYTADRLSGRPYQEGGLSNLIAQGYFKTIVTPVTWERIDHSTVAIVRAGPVIDGQKLDQYRLHHWETHFAYFQCSSNQVPGSLGATVLSAVDPKR
jgi:hypothetical protein